MQGSDGERDGRGAVAIAITAAITTANLLLGRIITLAQPSGMQPARQPKQNQQRALILRGGESIDDYAQRAESCV